jgi:hypothetical protein
MAQGRKTDGEGPNPSGLCMCGCGQQAPLAKRGRIKGGYVKGQPLRYRPGHQVQTIIRKPRLTRTKKSGYILILQPQHPRADKEGHVPEHMLLAERALGKILPPKAVVHHIDGTRHNNKNNNLVICESQSYHLLLHRRARAIKACGRASWRKCAICKQWDDPQHLCFSGGSTTLHAECRKQYHRNLRLIERRMSKSLPCVEEEAI